MIPILPIFDILGKVIDRVIPDPAEKAKLQLELAQLADQQASREHSENMGQIEVNKVEAASSSLFVAGWRPAIGWGCGLALLYNTLVAPLFHLGIADLGFLQTILMAMLGLGTMRSFEKAKGVATEVVGATTTVVSTTVAPPKKKFLGLIKMSAPEKTPWE